MSNDWKELKRKIAAVLAQDIGELDQYQQGYQQALKWTQLTMSQIENPPLVS